MGLTVNNLSQIARTVRSSQHLEMMAGSAHSGLSLNGTGTKISTYPTSGAGNEEEKLLASQEQKTISVAGQSLL